MKPKHFFLFMETNRINMINWYSMRIKRAISTCVHIWCDITHRDTVASHCFDNVSDVRVNTLVLLKINTNKWMSRYQIGMCVDCLLKANGIENERLCHLAMWIKIINECRQIFSLSVIYFSWWIFNIYTYFCYFLDKFVSLWVFFRCSSNITTKIGKCCFFCKTSK